MQGFSTNRDILAWKVETLSKTKFTTTKKGQSYLEDAEWIVDEPVNFNNCMSISFDYVAPYKHGRYSSWSSLEALAEAAGEINPNFKSYWRTIVKFHPYKVNISKPSSSSDISCKDVFNFLRLDLYNCLHLLESGQTEILKEWVSRLKIEKTTYLSPVKDLPWKIIKT
jgi:hypothetical protein